MAAKGMTMLMLVLGLVEGSLPVGKVAWFDPMSALHGEESAKEGCSPRALGSWSERLGAVTPSGNDVPVVADILWPLDTVTLLIVALEDKEEIASFMNEDTWISTLSTSALIAEDDEDAMIMCDHQRHLLASEDSEAALQRFLHNPESHPLAAAISAHGGSVSDSFVKGSASAPGLDIKDSALNRRLLADLTLLVESAHMERPQREARIFKAPKIDQVSSRSAALSLLDATARAVSTAQSNKRTATAIAILGKEINSLPPATRKLLDDSNTYYPISDIRQFQLNMWTGIGFVLILAAAIAAMVNMNPEYDSLLYATFQANVSGGGMSKLE